MKKKNSGDDVGFKNLDECVWKNPPPVKQKILKPLPEPLPNTKLPKL
ncbi:hypothetical protein PI95_029825 [Hassallia byssoidea VB512170]|jgi:hypothetical protein|uniref:Uncharacterized protein n=1 Tax=Hassallia byssoidea VB512170 TaxID=1304833 RepID=A0A846HGI1_9CYAN|nr:hypothetical protein [Hassalia byssoidea]NEU76597.1 hypothetical protein [Hassalia byssoidea VB512170]